MAENDLSGKVGLDVTDFKTSVAEMNREIRVLESGFRATASSLGDWGKSASGLELRIQTLNDEIGIQQKKVQALWGEYQKVAAEKGATSKAAQDLEIRLNKETETLGKMGVELNSTQAALDQMGKEADQTSSDVYRLDKEEQANIGTMGRFGAALNGLKEHLTNVGRGFVDLGNKVLSIGKNIAIGLGAAAIGAAVGLGAMVKKTAEAADEMVEMSDKTGISIETLQILSYQAEQTGTSLETVTGAMARNVRSMASAEKGTGAARDAYRALGISVTDLDGNLRDSQVVFAEALAALGGIENETQRDAIAMALFGKSAQELNPLIALGADGLAKMAAEAKNMGAIMSEDAVRAAADLNDKLASLKAGVKGLGAKIGGALAPAITKIITKFQDWLQSPAVQDGIKKLTENIGKIADKIGEVVTKLMSGDIGGALGEIFPPETVAQIMNIAKVISDFINNTLIPFVTKHAEEIKGAIIAIGAVLATAGIVSLLASIANPIGLIIALVGLLGAAWAGNWGGIRDKLTEVWAVVQPVLQDLWNWLQINIPIAIQTVSDFWNTTLLPALTDVWNFIQINIIPVLQDVWNWLKVNIPIAIQTAADFWNGTLLPALTDIWNFIQINIIPIFQDVWNWLQTNIPAAIQTASDFWNNTLLPALTDIWNFISVNIIPIFTDVWTWLQTNIPAAIQSTKDFIQKLIDIFSDLWDKINKDVLPVLREVYDFIVGSFTAAFDGIEKAISRVVDAIQRMIDKLKKVPKATPPQFQANSPTPFEMGMRGISAAIEEINSLRLPQMTQGLKNLDVSTLRGLALQPGGLQPAGAALSAAGNTTTIYGGVHLYDVQNADDLLLQLTRLSG